MLPPLLLVFEMLQGRLRVALAAPSELLARLKLAELLAYLLGRLALLLVPAPSELIAHFAPSELIARP